MEEVGLLKLPRALATAASMVGCSDETTEEVREETEAPDDGEDEKEPLVAPVDPENLEPEAPAN